MEFVTDTHFKHQHYVEVSGQLHAPAISPRRGVLGIQSTVIRKRTFLTLPRIESPSSSFRMGIL